MRRSSKLKLAIAILVMIAAIAFAAVHSAQASAAAPAQTVHCHINQGPTVADVTIHVGLNGAGGFNGATGICIGTAALGTAHE